ncbi:hypothetical protein [Teichococcus vastitatis]|uniref:Uncharacterized protein n=1 Tax=Teichococcus vastitatis TaxID=2307076 RepID=A0ABS9WCH4_9PROT|nr:hypothetical protein [Pseudoroseomonas vastitatis]MCI0756913.1 hypothetical protein [Pseudoroseomonas vastitatis]
MPAAPQNKSVIAATRVLRLNVNAALNLLLNNPVISFRPETRPMPSRIHLHPLHALGLRLGRIMRILSRWTRRDGYRPERRYMRGRV